MSLRGLTIVTLLVAALIVVLVSTTGSPTPRHADAGAGPAVVWGDIDCDGSVGATDGLKGLQDVAGIPYAQEEGCPVVGVDFGGLVPWGDWDCSGEANSVDSLQVLRHVAGLSVNQADPCPAFGDPAVPAGLTIDVDENVQPQQEFLPPLEDHVPRPLSSIQAENGDQFDFVSNEILIVADTDEALNDFLEQYDGEILDEDVSEGPSALAQPAAASGTPKLARVTPEDQEKEAIQSLMNILNPSSNQKYRVSDIEGMQLLGTVAAANTTDGVSANPHWVDYGEAFAQENVFEIEQYLTPDCSYQLLQELQLIQQLGEGQITPEQALQQLEGTIGDPSDCKTPPPTYNLFDGLVLDEIEPGEPVTIVLNPPVNIPDGFTAEITSALGTFTSNTLFGGSLRLDTDGMQLALATPETFEIPICARSEAFTIELSYPGGSQSFDVILPVAFRVQPLDVLLTPGVEASVPLCASGDRGDRDWSWVQPEGDPFPPPGLSLDSAGDGDAVIGGTPTVNEWSSQGRLHVQQDGEVAEAAASVQVAVLFFDTLNDACPANYELMPKSAFECELPRPQNYEEYSWQVQSADDVPNELIVEDELYLEQRGLRWYFGGELPFSLQIGGFGGEVLSAVGRHNVTFEMVVPGIPQPVATREVTLDVGIPFSVWTQNTILRPNNPFVPNTGDDNEQRTDDVINRISNYDIVALQEVFDDDQRSQLSAGVTAQGYDLLWGPTEEGSCLNITKPCKEESGLALLIRGGLTTSSLAPADRHIQLLNSHHSELFGECAGPDCWAKKGFSSSFVPLQGADNFIYVMNTHLNSAGDTPGDFSDTRRDQLEEIMDYVDNSQLEEYPVVFMGDLNIVANKGEYNTVIAPEGPLDGWDDVIFDRFSNLVPPDPDGPLTIDKTRNAYAHFWDDHLFDHIAEDLGQEQCLQIYGIVCPEFPIQHPDTTERLDYILIKQGTDFHIEADPASIRMTDDYVATDLCANVFPMADHPGMQCYLSDHFGVTANLRYVRAPEAEPPATPTPAPTLAPTPTATPTPSPTPTPTPEECPGDADCDGVPDETDECPLIPGDFNGCPGRVPGSRSDDALAAGAAILAMPLVGFAGLTLTTRTRRRRG